VRAGDKRPAPRRGADDERPKAPWHPFPLVELSVLIGLVLCVLGLFDLQSERGRILLGFGLLLGSLGGMDTALREHFSGYRSHSTVLAGLPAVVAAGLVFFTGVPWPVVSATALIAFALAFLVLRRAFQKRSGGLSFR
jgi:hypothetical protein